MDTQTTADPQPQPDPVEDNTPTEPCPFEVGQTVFMNGQNVEMTVDGCFTHPAAPIWIVSLLWFAEDNTLQRAQLDSRILCAG